MYLIGLNNLFLWCFLPAVRYICRYNWSRMTVAKKLGKIQGARVRKDGSWEAVLVVPADCVAALNGRKAFTKRCGKRYAEAVKEVRKAHAEFERQIAIARTMSSRDHQSPHPDRRPALVDPRTATRAIEVPTRFRDFDDYWSPFLGGQGPAPAYAMSLVDERRAALRERLRATLPTASDGSIPLRARAWAVRGYKTAG